MSRLSTAVTTATSSRQAASSQHWRPREALQKTPDLLEEAGRLATKPISSSPLTSTNGGQACSAAAQIHRRQPARVAHRPRPRLSGSLSVTPAWCGTKGVAADAVERRARAHPGNRKTLASALSRPRRPSAMRRLSTARTFKQQGHARAKCAPAPTADRAVSSGFQRQMDDTARTRRERIPLNHAENRSIKPKNRRPAEGAHICPSVFQDRCIQPLCHLSTCGA